MQSRKKSSVEPVFQGCIAQKYDAWFENAKGRYASQMENDLLRRLIPETSGKLVLDVGCGTGNHLKEFTHKACLAAGVDVSKDMLRLAYKKVPFRAQFVLADAHALPFRDSTFDIVLWITSLEFFSDPVSALAEGRRVGKGTGVVAVLNKWSLSSTQRRIKMYFRPSVFRSAKFYSPLELYRLARAAFGKPFRFHWRTTMFTFPVVPGPLRPVLRIMDRVLEWFRSPFGAFLAACIKRPEGGKPA